MALNNNSRAIDGKIINRVPYIVYNLPKKNDQILQSDILSILELHYGVAPTVHIHTKVYGCQVVKYASFKLLSPPDPFLKKLHGFLLDGCHLLVCQRNLWDFDKYCHHDPESRSIWIYQIPKEATEENVWQLFESFGRIKFLFFIRDNRKGTPIHCFLEFWEHKTLICSLKLDKKPFLSQSIRLREFSVEKGVFLNHLPTTTKLQDIECLLQELSPLHVCFTPNSNSTRVYFSEESAYSKALSLNRKLLNGVPVTISGSYSTSHHVTTPNPATRCVYVTNLPSETSVLDLKHSFDWNIKHLKKCNHGISKITFESTDKAEAALKIPDPVIHGIKLSLFSDFSQASYAAQKNFKEPKVMNETTDILKKNVPPKKRIHGPNSNTSCIKVENINNSTDLKVRGRKKSMDFKVSVSKSSKLGKNASSALPPRAKLKKIILKKGWTVSCL